MPRHFPALRCASSLLFEASIIKERKFALSNFWRCSAEIIGAMELTITDSYFALAMANLGTKIFETSLEVAIRTLKTVRK